MATKPFFGRLKWMLRWIVNIFGLIKWVLVLAAVIILVVIFLGVPLPVSGHSMENNFHDGQLVLIQRLGFSYNITRGDVVEARFPADPDHTKLIKRVLGLPGDTISFDDTGHVTVNGKALNETYSPIYGEYPVGVPATSYTLQSGEYFLMGDNRPGSSDSRVWGPVQQSDILGKIRFIILPLNQIHYVATPIYN